MIEIVKKIAQPTVPLRSIVRFAAVNYPDKDYPDKDRAQSQDPTCSTLFHAKTTGHKAYPLEYWPSEIDFS